MPSHTEWQVEAEDVWKGSGAEVLEPAPMSAVGCGADMIGRQADVQGVGSTGFQTAPLPGGELAARRASFGGASPIPFGVNRRREPS